MWLRLMPVPATPVSLSISVTLITLPKALILPSAAQLSASSPMRVAGVICKLGGRAGGRPHCPVLTVTQSRMRHGRGWEFYGNELVRFTHQQPGGRHTG
jgi:hypothetical protein